MLWHDILFHKSSNLHKTNPGPPADLHGRLICTELANQTITAIEAFSVYYKDHPFLTKSYEFSHPAITTLISAYRATAPEQLASGIWRFSNVASGEHLGGELIDDGLSNGLVAGKGKARVTEGGDGGFNIGKPLVLQNIYRYQ